MPSKRRVRFSHLLAPLALIAFVAAFAAILLSSGVVNGDDGTETTATTERPTTETTRTTPAGRRLRTFYIVKLNDTFEGISRKTGVSVQRLQELNPEADPQALVAGQRLRLRE
jgi:LysM repeat protein